MPKTDNSEITFEEGIQKLEAIVDAMESGDLPLETLMKQFEDGTKLAKLCQEKLSQAEVRIQQIEQSSGGALIHEMAQNPDGSEDSTESLSGGVGLPIPAASKAAKKGHGRGEKAEN